MNAPTQEARDAAILATLNRLAATMERQEAATLAMLQELRRPGKEDGGAVDLEAALQAAWAFKADALWQLRELADAGVIPSAEVRPLSIAMRELMREGGRCGDLVLHRSETDGKGRVWHLSKIGNDVRTLAGWHPT